MKQEEVVAGAYVRWVADRYMGGWDIHGRIVKVFVDDEYNGHHKVTVLGFDDMKENTVAMPTIMNECTIATEVEARHYFQKKILVKREAYLDAQLKVDELLNQIRVMETEWSKMV
jgi:hypothetical protein